MPIDELESEIAAGVVFSGYEVDGQLVGVMGIQHVRDVDLIRHAYVLPGSQHHGVGRDECSQARVDAPCVRRPAAANCERCEHREWNLCIHCQCISHVLVRA